MATRKPAPEPTPLTEAPPKARGHYTTPYGRFKSVTTILEAGFPKPNLVPWSAKLAAQAAVDHAPWLATLRGQNQRDEAVAWIKAAHKRYLTEAQDHGTDVHRYLEARLLGAPTPEATSERLAACYAAVEHFLDTMTPDLEAAELVVAHPGHGYAGTLDGILAFPRHQVRIPGLTCLDAKSGKSTYGETGMQVGAYRRCTVGWTRAGQEFELPAVDHGHVLHIRPPGGPTLADPDDPGAGPDGWALKPLDTSDRVHDVFLAVKAVADGASFIDRKVVGAPLDTTPDLIDAVLDAVTTPTAPTSAA